MGYYYITLSPVSRKLCTIVLPWGKFENCLEYVRAYIDDLLFIRNGNFEDHLNKVKIVLKKLNAAGFKINEEKSFFSKDNLEYLGFKITLPDKVQAIKDIAAPTNRKQFRSFVEGE